jgi:hypothetical protein
MQDQLLSMRDVAKLSPDGWTVGHTWRVLSRVHREANGTLLQRSSVAGQWKISKNKLERLFPTWFASSHEHISLRDIAEVQATILAEIRSLHRRLDASLTHCK